MNQNEEESVFSLIVESLSSLVSRSRQHRLECFLIYNIVWIVNGGRKNVYVQWHCII